VKILLRDSNLPETAPLTRFRSVFNLRNGIYSEIERLKIASPEAEFYFRHPDLSYEIIISRMENFQSYSENKIPDDQFDLVIESQHLSPFRMLNHVRESIEKDIPLFTYRGNYFTGAGIVSGEMLPPPLKNLSELTLIGPEDQLFFHEDIEILPGSVFDMRKGPIVLDAGVSISPFTYIEGPLYAGKNARLDNARITGGCILGHEVRAGGEIENSIFNDFSNKHHEGFVGHSVLGSWVNLGALATTSDLKNNYGEVRLLLPEGDPMGSDLIEIPGGTIKFGSIIGDSVKISIGTMLYTGTVIDAGANVFGGNPEKDIPPLSWGLDGSLYRKDRFLKDQETIYKRRNQEPHPDLKNLIDLLQP